MKPAAPKKWYIKDINPPSTKRLALNNCSPGDRPSQPLQNTFTAFAVTPNDLQAVGSSRTSKRKPNQISSYKQHRPPSAEITSRNPNPPVVNPLSTSSKLRPKPMIYNVTSPKIKVKTQNNPFSSSQRSFPSTSFSKPVVKAKTCNELICEAKIDKTEQASKSTQCVNESSKSIQQLNETSLTIKAENPENSTKNVPLVSPVNQMMRRLTLSEKEKNGDSGSKSSGIRPKAEDENIFSVQNGGDSGNKSSGVGVRPFMRESEADKKKVQVRSYSQNPKPPMSGAVNNYSPEPNAKIKVGSLQIGSPKKLDNPLQKITNLVKEISELEGNGDYDRMRNYVKELEDKITDLKSSIELNGRNQRKPNIFFYGENKENKQMPLRETQYPVASENGLNNLVTSVRSQVRSPEQKDSKINVIQVQNLINGNMNNNQKHQYPKSTTNADLQRKKFDFQNKPVSIKIQTINPQEELIPEEPQVSISQEHSGGTCRLMSPNVEKMRRPLRYYISNAVNSFYRPLNMYEDSCEDNYFSQLCQEHMMQTFQSLHLSRNLFNNAENHCFEEKCFGLEKRESHKFKKTLIFDLDETLVHCNESLELPADVVLPIIFPNGQKIEAGINIRPYTKEILKELSQYYEIIVFTASHSCYANVVLDFLDENKEFIHHRMYREHCISTKEGVFIKDLRVIKNRSLEEMIIVDNAAYSFAFQLENGIPILPFYDFKADRELLYLKDYLIELAQAENIREMNSNAFKLHEFEKYEELQELIEKELRNYVQ